MFSRRNVSELDLAIDRAIRDLKNHNLGSEPYLISLNMATELTKLKKEQRSLAISKDTIAVVGGNLLGIFMIIKHESVNVVTSRAMSLLLKPR
jgi:hypothetical protein